MSRHGWAVIAALVGASLAFWTVAYVFFFANDPSAPPRLALGHAFVMALGHEASFVSMACAGVFVGWRLPDHSKRPLLHALTAVGVTLLAVGCAVAARYLTRAVIGMPIGHVNEYMAGQFPAYFNSYLAFTGLGYGMRRIAQFHEARELAARTQASLAAVQFRTSRDVLRPEYLIERLDEIAKHVEHSPRTVDHAIIQFADLLRLSLQRSHSDYVSVHSEVSFIRAHVALECVSGRQISVSAALSPHLERTHVPRSILTGLAELAIQLNPAGALRIEIAGEIDSEMIRLAVLDDGTRRVAEREAHAAWERVHEYRQVLDYWYGPVAGFDTIDLPSGGVRATVRIPRVLPENHAFPGRGNADAVDEPMVLQPEEGAPLARWNATSFPAGAGRRSVTLLWFWMASLAPFAIASPVTLAAAPEKGLLLELLSGAILATVFTASWVAAVGLPYPARSSSVAALAVTGALSFAAMNVLFTLADFFIWNLYDICCVFDTRWLADRLISAPWIFFFIGSALVFRQGLAGTEEAREARIRSARLSADLARLRLELLDNQLRPHFLFNTLQSIATLVHRDRAGAAAMLRQLTTLLRNAVAQSVRSEITLDEEVETLKLYAAIEAVRFPNLQVVFHIPDDTRWAFVPNLLLQPLVENSIRHSVAKSNGGRVEVRSALVEGGTMLALSVIDDGAGMQTTPDRTSTQVGFANVRSRLAVLYGANAQLESRSAADRGFEVLIRIPFHQTVSGSIDGRTQQTRPTESRLGHTREATNG
jgi:LytS/YehU family sensor histidine kinase